MKLEQMLWDNYFEYDWTVQDKLNLQSEDTRLLVREDMTLQEQMDTKTLGQKGSWVEKVENRMLVVETGSWVVVDIH